MKTDKKRLKLIICILSLLVIIAGLFYFFSQNDNKNITNFATSYKKFDNLTSDFFVPVIASNIEENPNLANFNKTYTQITDSIQNTDTNNDRLTLAKKAIDLNKTLIEYINITDAKENDAVDALLELNTKAAAIKDTYLRSKAIEIADLSQQELDNIIAYKKTVLEKKYTINQLLQNIVDDNGGLENFINFLKQKNNQTKVENQNLELDRLTKKFGELTKNRTTAYARFQGLTGIKK